MAYRIIRNYLPSDIENFRSLKGKGGLFEQGLFIAEGEKIVRKVLESSLEVSSAYMTEEHFRSFHTWLRNRADATHTTDVYLATKQEMEDVVGYPLHQGIMLACKIPDNRPLKTAMQQWQSPWMATALDGIADAENMGAIIRNAAAFGASAVIVDDQSCNPYLRRSVRVSMGTIVDMEIIFVDDLSVSLKAIRQMGSIRLIGASLAANSIDLAKLEIAENTILVFGSEGWGLRKETIAACDTLVQIPIAGNVDSLNVAIASGIFMHWLKR